MVLRHCQLRWPGSAQSKLEERAEIFNEQVFLTDWESGQPI